MYRTTIQAFPHFLWDRNLIDACDKSKGFGYYATVGSQ